MVQLVHLVVAVLVDLQVFLVLVVHLVLVDLVLVVGHQEVQDLLAQEEQAVVLEHQQQMEHQVVQVLLVPQD
jgi:hypothetical protein